ncbi:MAG: zinc ribbon domain-containing protein [Prevotella sp.]|nr:zinc ribbon domain-containing protein [Prevotella sp.]
MDQYIDTLDTTAGKMREKQLIMPKEETIPALNQNSENITEQNAAQQLVCPNCGNPIDIDTDYCEACHIYIKRDVCSFCGAHLDGMEGFCPECGNPLGGIVCPVCHTMNDFAFCKQCGTPLTDDAREMKEQIKAMPEYKELMELGKEMGNLEKIIPYTSERDIEKENQGRDLRRRVLMLLAEDSGMGNAVIEERKTSRTTIEKLKKQKNNVQQKLAALLSKIETKPTIKPAQARNYAMATKPAGVRLGWVCNYKHALHSSPCGCAKPQMGGKWVVLGKNDTDLIKDDKQ